MLSIIEFIASKMKEYRIGTFDTDMVLMEVSAGASKDVGQSGQFVFLVSFSTDNGSASGRMVSSDNGVELTPAVMNTQAFKYQKFRGTTTVRNTASDNTLYVEAVIVTPIMCQSDQCEAKKM